MWENSPGRAELQAETQTDKLGQSEYSPWCNSLGHEYYNTYVFLFNLMVFFFKIVTTNSAVFFLWGRRVFVAHFVSISLLSRSRTVAPSLRPRVVEVIPFGPQSVWCTCTCVKGHRHISDSLSQGPKWVLCLTNVLWVEKPHSNVDVFCPLESCTEKSCLQQIVCDVVFRCFTVGLFGHHFLKVLSRILLEKEAIQLLAFVFHLDCFIFMP